MRVMFVGVLSQMALAFWLIVQPELIVGWLPPLEQPPWI